MDDFYVLLRLFRTAHPGLSRGRGEGGGKGQGVERRRVTLTDVRQTFPIILNSRKSTTLRLCREIEVFVLLRARLPTKMAEAEFRTCEAHNAYSDARFLKRILVYMYKCV